MNKNSSLLEGTDGKGNKSPFPCSDFRWECSSCRCLLGFMDNNCETVRIKHRDLYIEATGGKLTVTCRRCAKKNTLQQESDWAQEVNNVI